MRNRLADIERETTGLTARLQEIEALLADPEHYKDSRKIIEINREYKNIQENISSLNSEREGLSAEAERLRQEHEARLKEL